MRIYSMTATFGKLEHETLTLKPGLNVISAPNEWGKSTWCAFLIAMLYGLDTRAKSTKNALVDKERYAPWSGQLMSGRIDLNWQGRDITIQRITRKRTPLGVFRAFETDSGLEVSELTADNCGQMLLGVERSVFTRTAFIRFQDLSVTDDEALRRRLNNLVTTGSENEDADRLAGELKTLRNRIRYNRTGLLPQLESERDALAETCREWDNLLRQAEDTQQQLDQLEDWRKVLENHAQALACQAYEESQRKLAQAEQARDRALAARRQISAQCAQLPSRQSAETMLARLDRLRQQRQTLEEVLDALPQTPPAGMLPTQFAGLTPDQAKQKAASDADAYQTLKKPAPLWLLSLGLPAVLVGLLAPMQQVPKLVFLIAGCLLLVISGAILLLRRGRRQRMEAFYGSSDTARWLQLAEEYAAGCYLHSPQADAHRQARSDAEQRLRDLNETIRVQTEGLGLDRCCSRWEKNLALHTQLIAAQEAYEQAQTHLDALKPLVSPTPPPEFPDKLTQSKEETLRLLEECRREKSHLTHLLGQYQGRMDALGSREALETRLIQKNVRIQQLEQTYLALTLAQETLAEATAELQRRFAPRIAARARELMGQMTGGRYDKLTLNRDLTLLAGTGQEDVLHAALWRSDGTWDQLYLSLRLAVAEELLPGMPLILDDALLRFDDTRLKAALDILKEQSRSRQVILFTCQNREQQLL